MSLIGKFFVVMQILLSVTFMGFAVAVFTFQTNYRDVAETERNAKIKIQSEMQNLQGEYDKFKLDTTEELNLARGQVETVESTNAALQLQLEDRKRENERLANDLQSQTTLAEVTENEAKSRVVEAMTQRTVNTQLHEKLKTLKDDYRVAQDELYNLKVDKETLTSKNRQQLEEIAFLRKVVRNNNLETDPRIYAAQNDPPPKVDGVVKNAATNDRGSVDLVEVSLGSDDGLVKGHKLSVYRTGLENTGPAKYLGQIQLVSVDTDHAVGVVVEKAKNGIIQRGDNVTSKY